MSLINGSGGVFLFTNNVKRLVEWYRDCLGMVPEGTDSECESFYTTFEYRDLENPGIKRTIAWAIMPTDQDITDKPRTGRFNYSVRSMAETLAQVKTRRAQSVPLIYSGITFRRFMKQQSDRA